MKQKVFNGLLIGGSIFFMLLVSALFAFATLNTFEFKFISYLSIPLVFIVWAIVLELVDRAMKQSKKVKDLKKEIEQRKLEVNRELSKMEIEGSFNSRMFTSKLVVLRRNRDENISEIENKMHDIMVSIEESHRELKVLGNILNLYYASPEIVSDTPTEEDKVSKETDTTSTEA